MWSSQLVWSGCNWVNIRSDFQAVELMAKGVRDQTVKDSGVSAFKAACLQKSDIYPIFRIFKSQDVLVTCFVPAPFMPPLISR